MAGAAAAALALLNADGVLAQGCAMCATYVTEADPVAHAMKYSILFLMAMPFTMLAVVGGWFYFAYRGRRRAAFPRLLNTAREGEL